MWFLPNWGGGGVPQNQTISISFHLKASLYGLREATWGSGVVVCPECADEVHWGALMHHRTIGYHQPLYLFVINKVTFGVPNA